MKLEKRLDPKDSWRNHQRVQFIKGFYWIRDQVNTLFREYERTGEIEHRQIDFLLEKKVRELKDLSHILYRVSDEVSIDRKKQRIFDKVFGEMWHELDKSRDNIRLIEVYSNLFENNHDPDANGKNSMLKALGRLDHQVLTAARRDLPYLLRRSKRIMDQLVPLFEEILGVYRENEIVLRSLYFAKEDLDSLCRPSTVEYFFPLIHGSVENGYHRLINSLITSKHLKQARKVLDEFKTWIKTHTHKPAAEVLCQQLEDRLNEA
ncbi:MAG: hypothetical protein RBU29_02830 [bacterium]|jgi:hypothetical protein|nr:hypothetical protein [bacterium]